MANVNVDITPPRLKRNFRLYFIVNFFSSAQFSLPIYMLFGVDYLGVSYLQAGALFLISWIVSLCCDFLTGTIADRYGRKKVFAVGICLQIASTLPFVLTKNYGMLVGASLIAGIGMALVSNTLNALLYEQSKEKGKIKYFQHANAIAGAFSYSGRIIASLVGGFAYFVHPTLPYGLTIGALFLALMAGQGMYFSKKVEKHAGNDTNVGIMKSAWKIFSSNPALIKFTVVISLISIWGDYIFTNYQPFYIDQGVSPVTLGYIYAGISLLSATGSIAMRHIPNKLSAHAINSATLVGIILTVLILMIFKVPMAYLAPLGLAIVSGFSMPNLNLYVNGHAPARIRSSVLSIATTATGIGSGIGIFLALQLIDRISFQQIMIVCLVGCGITLVGNILFRTAEKSID